MKRIIFLSSLIISAIIILNLLTSIYTLWHKQDLLTKAEKELTQEKKENVTLKKQLTVVTSSSFMEEEARNKLFMTKPTEQQVIIAPDLITSQKSSSSSADTKPYWQQWLAMFSL